MKILCISDFAVTTDMLKKLELLEKYGATVTYLDDERLQSPKTITEFVLRGEQHGVDACDAYGPLLEAVADVDILVTHISPITSQVINAGKQLKCVCSLRSSHTNIQTELCAQRNIRVIEAPGRNANGVADCTIGLMLAEMRNIARGHHYLMQGQWRKTFSNFYETKDICRCTVGIVGTGFIGQKVIDRLAGFGCKILGFDPYMSPEAVGALGITAVSLDELLAQSDIVSLHLRLSEQTQGYVGREQLSMMKRSAYLVNTARAGLVDEAALVEALQSKALAGAALDVFNEEPLSADCPYLALDNVTIAPHVAGTTIDAFANSVDIILHALEEMFLGNPIPGLVK